MGSSSPHEHGVGQFSKAMNLWDTIRAKGIILFYQHLGGTVTALLIYVDDIVVAGNNEEEQQLLKQNLDKEFEIKDLGVLKYFLGIEVAY